MHHIIKTKLDKVCCNGSGINLLESSNISVPINKINIHPKIYFNIENKKCAYCNSFFILQKN